MGCPADGTARTGQLAGHAVHPYLWWWMGQWALDRSSLLHPIKDGPTWHRKLLAMFACSTRQVGGDNYNYLCKYYSSRSGKDSACTSAWLHFSLFTVFLCFFIFRNSWLGRNEELKVLPFFFFLCGSLNSNWSFFESKSLPTPPYTSSSFRCTKPCPTRFYLRMLKSEESFHSLLLCWMWREENLFVPLLLVEDNGGLMWRGGTNEDGCSEWFQVLFLPFFFLFSLLRKDKGSRLARIASLGWWGCGARLGVFEAVVMLLLLGFFFFFFFWNRVWWWGIAKDSGFTVWIWKLQGQRWRGSSGFEWFGVGNLKSVDGSV